MKSRTLFTHGMMCETMPATTSLAGVVPTRDRIARAGFAGSARPDLHIIRRSFPKISMFRYQSLRRTEIGKTEIYQAAAHGEVAARVDRWHAKARIGYAFPRLQWKSDLATASVTCAGSPCRI